MGQQLTTVPNDLSNTRSLEQRIQCRNRRVQTLSRQIDGTSNSASLQCCQQRSIFLLVCNLQHDRFFADRRG